MRSEETFSWLDGGYYLVQTYETVFDDEPAQKGVNYWFYESDRSGFRIIFFSNNGPYTKAGNQYAGGVEHDKLTMVGPAVSSTTWMKTGRSGRIPTVRSRSHGGSSTSAASGSRGR